MENLKIQRKREQMGYSWQKKGDRRTRVIACRPPNTTHLFIWWYDPVDSLLYKWTRQWKKRFHGQGQSNPLILKRDNDEPSINLESPSHFPINDYYIMDWRQILGWQMSPPATTHIILFNWNSNQVVSSWFPSPPFSYITHKAICFLLVS